MHRMTFRLLRNREDAADVVQEAFCRLWPRKEAIRDREEASALAVATVRNLCVDELRRRGKVDLCDIEEERDGCPELSPCEELELRERYEWVDRCVQERLSEVQRAIWKLRAEEELSTVEIAELLGMQPTAVRMNLSRARQKIRELYEEWNNGKR